MKPTIDERFEAFNTANPKVLEKLESLAARYAARGHKRMGLRMLWEVVRWECMMETTDESSLFKLNDNYISRYARLIARRHPEWARLFETRTLKAA